MIRWKASVSLWAVRGWGITKRSTASYMRRNAKPGDKKRIRAEHEPYLRAKTTEALKDIKKDGGHLWGLCGWLIDKILAERT